MHRVLCLPSRPLPTISHSSLAWCGGSATTVCLLLPSLRSRGPGKAGACLLPASFSRRSKLAWVLIWKKGEISLTFPPPFPPNLSSDLSEVQQQKIAAVVYGLSVLY